MRNLLMLQLALDVLLSAGSLDNQIGFCLDQIPSVLKGTGYTAVSKLSDDECIKAGHDWCPLSKETDSWENVEYYIFSACCTGKQGRNLIPDPTSGVPSCRNGTLAQECTRMVWQAKFLHDFIDASSGYNKEVSPLLAKMTDSFQNQTSDCICAPSDKECEKKSEDGSRCLICSTNQPCRGDPVEFGINFFKIHSIDLKTSGLSAAVWIRQMWYDPRLSHDPQCYGGMEYFEVMAQAASLENSKIWTPDIELLNNHQSIWQGNIPGRLAMVYSCWDGKPSRGGCGYVWWSRSGILEALCKYQGLVKFPFDQLSCQLEMSAFAIDGRYQDLLLRKKDGGVEWLHDQQNVVTGLTAGSKFQDYQIENITAQRKVAVYPCCEKAPYPELIYTINFKRSQSYYVSILVFPGVLLALLSFVPFWMDPSTGERLGYCVTIILAMITNQIVASSYMPVCEEKVLMDYLNQTSLLFGALSLLETACALYLHHLHVEGWWDAIVPKALHKLCVQGVELGKTLRSPKSGAIAKIDDSDHHFHVRKQSYRQVFYLIDADFSDTIDWDEVNEFGQYVSGGHWDKTRALELLRKYDHDKDGALSCDEFACLCEQHLLAPFKHDPNMVKQLVKGWISGIERKRQARAAMWHHRSQKLDEFARWSVPPGFICFVFVLFSLSEETLSNMSLERGRQVQLLLSGFLSILGIICLSTAYAAYKFIRQRRSRAVDSKTTGDGQETPRSSRDGFAFPNLTSAAV